MLNIEELMKKLNGKGKITDKKTAIELLMISPNAWDLLSPELKKDEEIMLYVQPKLYVEVEGGPTFGAYEPEWAGVECDKRFKIDASINISCYASIKIKSMMPKFVLRKSNDFKKAYLNVQKRLDYKRTLSGDREYGLAAEKYNDIAENMEGVYGKTEYPYEGATDGYHDDFTVYEADLSVLPGIVDEEYQKYINTKRK